MRLRIEALARALDDKEAERREARDSLRESERAISQANRALAGLAAEGARLRAERADLAGRRRALERTVDERKAAIARMLVAQHRAGAPDALRAVLSGGDPGALDRKLHYIGHVSRAAAALLGAQRAALAELERLAAEADAQRARQQTLERAQRADRERLAAQREARRRVLARMAAELRNSRKEIKVLRADEARLARLVQEIARMMAERAQRAAGVETRNVPFSTLRGKLRLPVRGELIGRFGAPRGAAGAEAKGVFIRAPQGQPVRAIAHGQVVYADWMRGFGNILILDHGEAFLSIYANNESLLKQVGDAVASGESVATTGASGGNEQTGLYFELRHLGRAFDPLRWVNLK